MLRTIKFLAEHFRNRLSAADAFWRDLDAVTAEGTEATARKDRYVFPHDMERRYIEPVITTPHLNICFRPVMIDGKYELMLAGIVDDAGNEIDSLMLAGYGAEWSADGEFEQLSIDLDIN